MGGRKCPGSARWQPCEELWPASSMTKGKEVSSSPGSEDPEALAPVWRAAGCLDLSQLAGRNYCPWVVPEVRAGIAPGHPPLRWKSTPFIAEVWVRSRASSLLRKSSASSFILSLPISVSITKWGQCWEACRVHGPWGTHEALTQIGLGRGSQWPGPGRRQPEEWYHPLWLHNHLGVPFWDSQLRQGKATLGFQDDGLGVDILYPTKI